jgi:tetratricopeptide (TPR) repeat protein
MDYDRLRELQQKFEENPRRYFAPLANEYRKGGQPRRAIEICKAQLEHMPGHMSGQIVYGQALYEAGEFAEARQVFERALTVDPENLIALRSLGDMSLQTGNAPEARSWYVRLLDADPKDTSVIALISEIDSAAEAKPVPAQVPGIDTDVGDQQIPANLGAGADAEPIPEPALIESSEVEASAAPPEERQPETDDYPPLGLERHYPVAEPAGDSAAADGELAEGPTLEDLGVPAGASAAEGLTSARQDVNSALDAAAEDSAAVDSVDARAEAPLTPVEGLENADTRQPAAASAEMSSAQEPAESETRAESSTEAAPPREPVRAAPMEERSAPVASTEPFVNETMAKLYLKQGYNQLALKVYRQLLVARPDDQSLRDRIREIQDADRAQHPGEAVAEREPEPAAAPSLRAAAPQPTVEMRSETPAPREEPSEETPVEREAPRSPSIERPTPDSFPEEDDGFNFGRGSVDAPPDYAPSRERESVESPRSDERAEPEAIAARQPSIREFFATLGRRRPPRASFSASSRPVAQPSVEPAADSPQPFASSAPAATLDSVFAGATVSPADARAASRLAGAFSGSTGGSRTPPTPPMPTPRLNQRVQAQESEEDVAKFRAWLDGLTGE